MRRSRSLIIATLATLVLAAPARAAIGDIATVAGTGEIGATGDNGPATAALMSTAISVSPIAGGGYLIADQVSVVRSVSADGTISRLAGNGTVGFTGDGGPALSAQLSAAVSDAERMPDGSTLIADANNNVIRRVAPDGTITRVAGLATGEAGFSGDGGPATSARLSFPTDIAVTSDGGYLISDNDNNRIRKVSPDGIITTVAGTGAAGGTDGATATATINGPSSITGTADGGFLIAELDGNRIRKVKDGVVSRVAGVAAGTAGFSGDAGPATAATFNQPARVVGLGDGGYLIADRGNDRIRKVSPDGTITTVAGTGTAGYNGDGIPATTAQLNQPYGVAVDSDGNYLIADTIGRRIRKVDVRGPLAPPPPPPPSTTPPPPVAPVPAGREPGGNVRPPSITYIAKIGDKARYICDAGLWSNLAPGAQFSYAWYQANDVIHYSPATGFLGNRSKLISSKLDYDLPPADVGKKVYCVVSAQEWNGTTVTAYSPTVALTGRSDALLRLPIQTFASNYGDYRIRGIDVIQVTAPESSAKMFNYVPIGPVQAFPAFCGGGTPTAYLSQPGGACDKGTRDPQRVPYAGVPLDERKSTSALVYVGMKGKSAASFSQPLDVTLTARVGGKLLEGSITKQVVYPTVETSDYVTAAERGMGAYAVRFDLFLSWMYAAWQSGQPLTLEASASLPAGNYIQCQLLQVVTGCSYTDDKFRLDGIPVSDDFPDLTIRSLQLQATKGQTLNSPQSILAKAKEIYPGGDHVYVAPYSGNVDISAAAGYVNTDKVCKPFQSAKQTAVENVRDCRIAGVGAALDAWWLADKANRSGYNMLLAAHRYPSGSGRDEPGSKRGSTVLTTPGGMPTLSINDGSLNRPLTAAAHEYGHALTLPHAGQNCNSTRVGDPQQGEFWDSDDMGRLQGMTGERDSVFSSANLTTRVDGSPNNVFDLMSYCANESTAWLSARNWNRAWDTLMRFQAAQTRSAIRVAPVAHAAAAGPQALAIGFFGPTGAVIDRVIPASSDNLPDAADPSSPLRLRAYDGAGNLLSETGVLRSPSSDGGPDTGNFAAGVPAAAKRVEVVTDGAVLDAKAASKAPTVKITGLRTGSSVAVTWKASDPDGDPLFASVEYSTDNGRTWRNVIQGPSTGSATVPGRYLQAADKARIRVTITDGFSAASAESRPFAAKGTPPTAEIITPRTSDDLQAGRVRLTGRGMNDAAVPLGKRSLTWFAGKQKLGTGPLLAARLPAGTVKLRLVVRDARGRTGTATRTLRVKPLPLRFTTLGVPPHVKAGAKTIRLKLSSTIPATLSAGGKKFSVGSKAKTYTITLASKPKLGLVTIKLTLKAKGVTQADQKLTVTTLRV